MSQFVIRRLISTIPVLIGISIVVFGLARMIPGNPCRAQLGERATEEVCERFNRRYGLDQPMPVQYLIWLFGRRVGGDDVLLCGQELEEATNLADPPCGVLFGDLGQSLSFQRPVTQILAERLPTTIELTLAAIIFAVIVGVPLGILSAYRHNSIFDVGAMLLSNIGVSMPVFWLGLMLIYVFSVWLPNISYEQTNPAGETIEVKPFEWAYLPPGRPPRVSFDDKFYTRWGWVEDQDEVTAGMEFVSRFTLLNAAITNNWELFFEAIRRLILPAVAVGTIPLAIIARMTRSSLLEVLSQDYVRTARAKGLREFVVVMRHALKNALLPVVTIIGLNFGFLISGAVLTETIFSFSGIGKTLFEAITARDYTTVQGVTLVTAVAFVFINLIVDVLYGYLDPRVRLE